MKERQGDEVNAGRSQPNIDICSLQRWIAIFLNLGLTVFRIPHKITLFLKPLSGRFTFPATSPLVVTDRVGRSDKGQRYLQYLCQGDRVAYRIRQGDCHGVF